MKVIIQIPCYNEEDSLPITLSELPHELDGVDCVEFLVINDGSIDRTVEVARAHGVHHVISHIRNLGLSQAFISGINACVQFGADIIVNTDADNQYSGKDIQKLIDPILRGEAEYVVGTRPIQTTSHFSFTKKILQKIGSWVVRKVAHAKVEDAPSGFRAISRNAALRLHVFNRYTYTLETIIQAGRMHFPVVSVPIKTNADIRPSRLISSTLKYLVRSLTTIIRSYMTYEPLRFFITPGLVLFFMTLILGIRYLVFYFQGQGAGHVQSLILALALFVLGVSLMIIGLLSDLIAVNRQLIEELDYRVKELHYDIVNKDASDDHQSVFSRAHLTYSIHSDDKSLKIEPPTA